MSHALARATRRLCLLSARETLRDARFHRRLAAIAHLRGDFAREHAHYGAACLAYHDAMSNFVAANTMKELEHKHVEGSEHGDG